MTQDGESKVKQITNLSRLFYYLNWKKKLSDATYYLQELFLQEYNTFFIFLINFQISLSQSFFTITSDMIASNREFRIWPNFQATLCLYR